MPKAKYADIYKSLKQKIENGNYKLQELLPSENTLVQEYECSRNTIRRAIADLVSDGYVQTMQGKGVRVIYQPALQTSFTIGGIESFKESAIRNHQKPETKVIHFVELIVDGKIAARTGFPLGAEIYYLQRLHYLDGKALILNHNYFLKSVAQGLTKEIAEKSIYDYLENIYFDAAGLLDEEHDQCVSKQKDYSVIEGYKVADYKEQPHTYMEE